MIDFLVGSLISISLKKILLSCVVKYTFTKINIFFSMFVREQLVLYTFLESQFQISFVFFFR